MSGKLTKSEIINLILDQDTDNVQNEEEIIHILLDTKISQNEAKATSFGDRVSDKMAQVAGSWIFIIFFLSCLVGWIILNVLILTKSFDPYPFILLNLILSCVAAIQAPIIMMSQNRQEKKDRIHAENDYKVNLKSELILEDLHSKLDELIHNQEQIISTINSTKKEDA